MAYLVHHSVWVEVVHAGLTFDLGEAYAIDSLGELRLHNLDGKSGFC